MVLQEVFLQVQDKRTLCSESRPCRAFNLQISLTEVRLQMIIKSNEFKDFRASKQPAHPFNPGCLGGWSSMKTYWSEIDFITGFTTNCCMIYHIAKTAKHLLWECNIASNFQKWGFTGYCHLFVPPPIGREFFWRQMDDYLGKQKHLRHHKINQNFLLVEYTIKLLLMENLLRSI